MTCNASRHIIAAMATTAVTPISISIREHREARGWSQYRLAKESGVLQSTISRIEAGKTPKVDLVTLEKLARALGVHPAALIEYTPERGKGRG